MQGSDTHNMIRVLIVGDHPLVREGIAALIDYMPDIRVVGEARNGQEAVDLFDLVRPDVTLMDLDMPHGDGIEAITAIREQHPHACILLMSISVDEKAIERALKAGAQGYYSKEAAGKELLRLIRTTYTQRASISKHPLGPCS